MRKVQMSSFDEMMANMYQVETGIKGHGSGVAGFPRSHDGLEKAIKLMFTPLSISSMLMSTRTALRLLIRPQTPMQNRAAAMVR